jgi:hypothetical protein
LAGKGAVESERAYYAADRLFLEAVVGKLAGASGLDSALPGERWNALWLHLQDLDNSEAADIIRWRYGPETDRYVALSQIARKQGYSLYKAMSIVQTAVLSLRLLHPELVRTMPEEARALFVQRHPVAGDKEMSLNQRDILTRALRNRGRYQDREFIRAVGDEEVLSLLRGMYGAKMRDLFARHYRLGIYRFSRSGMAGNNITNMRSDPERHLVIKAREMGRLAAEYLHDGKENLGRRAWMGMRGQKQAVSQADIDVFLQVLEEYEWYQQIAAALPGADLYPFQRAMLTALTQARLRAEKPTEAMRQFNQEHDTAYLLEEAKRLGNSVLRGETSGVGRAAQLVQSSRRVVTQEEAARHFSAALKSILTAYHVGRETSRAIAANHGVSKDYLRSLRRAAEKILTGEPRAKGSLSAEEIEALFTDEGLPEPLEEILQKYATGRYSTAYLAESVGLSRIGLGGLIKLAVAIDNELTEEKCR